MNTTKLNQKLSLMHGTFSPSEVNELILKSIDKQINACKLKNLSNWIHDHNCDQNVYRNQIAQLEKRKHHLQGMIKEAQITRCNLKLSETLEIDFDR